MKQHRPGYFDRVMKIIFQNSLLFVLAWFLNNIAVQVSKLRWRYADQSEKPLTMMEALYMATAGGGAFFGKVGSFEEGYECDAVILNDSLLPHPQGLSPQERLERAIYLGGDVKAMEAKYCRGVIIG